MIPKFKAPICVIALLSFSLLAPAAWAGTYLFFVPEALQLGGPAEEVYTPKGFGAHDGLAGAALVDASLKELSAFLPEALDVKVSVRGSTASVELAEAKTADATISDRALGAVYHTLRIAGIEEVTQGG